MNLDNVQGSAAHELFDALCLAALLEHIGALSDIVLLHVFFLNKLHLQWGRGGKDRRYACCKTGNCDCMLKFVDQLITVGLASFLRANLVKLLRMKVVDQP